MPGDFRGPVPLLILFSLLLALLLSMLMVWGWTIRGIWSGRPLLTDAPCIPLREAPWGALTVLSVIFLYLLVNAAVFRSYSAATGRHPPSAVETKLRESRSSACRGRRDRPHPEIQSQADLLIQLAIINGSSSSWCRRPTATPPGPGLPTSVDVGGLEKADGLGARGRPPDDRPPSSPSRAWPYGSGRLRTIRSS